MLIRLSSPKKVMEKQIVFAAGVAKSVSLKVTQLSLSGYFGCKVKYKRTTQLYINKKADISCEQMDDRKHGELFCIHTLLPPLTPTLYSFLDLQQIALRFIKILQQSYHLGTCSGLRSIPHALLTLSVKPSVQSIKSLVPLKSYLLSLNLVIRNEKTKSRHVFLKRQGRNGLFRFLSVV